MTSGKQARKQRQAQVQRPPVRSTEGRRASPKVLLGAGAAIVLVIVAVVLAIVLSGGGGGGSSATTGTTLPDANVIEQQFAGIPQQGNILGKATAPVTMREYVDLQCPICREFETTVMPTIIDKYVRTGKVKVEARVIAFIGADSERGRRATLAAGQQNKMFNFSQLLYFNQGAENTGWLDETMVVNAATSIPGLDVQALQDAQNGNAVADQTQTFDKQATADNVTGTPTVMVGKSGGTLIAVGSGSPTVEQLSATLDNALKGS